MTLAGPSVLRYEEAPTPEPASDQILIRVHAAGVNPVDGKIRSGTYRSQRIDQDLRDRGAPQD